MKDVCRKPNKTKGKNYFLLSPPITQSTFNTTTFYFHLLITQHTRTRMRRHPYASARVGGVKGESSESSFQTDSLGRVQRAEAANVQDSNHRDRSDRNKRNYGPIDATHLRDRGPGPTIKQIACVGPFWASRDACQTGTQDDLWHGSSPRFSSVLGAWERAPN